MEKVVVVASSAYHLVESLLVGRDAALSDTNLRRSPTRSAVGVGNGAGVGRLHKDGHGRILDHGAVAEAENRKADGGKLSRVGELGAVDSVDLNVAANGDR